MTFPPKIITFLLLAFNIFAVYYLLSPIPPLPDLTNSIKSDLPGDTVQLKNVSGYFTNQSRTQVMNFYLANYNGPFRIRLNHPPEKSKTIFRDTTQSYYLEEFYLPFKQTLFVNGYEWENDVFTKPEKRIANKLIYNGIEYKAKINTKIFYTSIPERFIGFFFTEFSIIIIIYLLKIVFFPKKNGWTNHLDHYSFI